MPSSIESVSRIEPARLETPTAAIADVIAELSAAAAVFGKALHPRTAANLASVVRLMNTYYSNLIEGHNTRPRDIERALAGDVDVEEDRRNLQIEALAHVRVQKRIDEEFFRSELPDPASSAFLQSLHREFYKGVPESMLRLKGVDREVVMVPGEWRSESSHDVAVGRHLPPSSDRVAEFMRYFETRYRRSDMGVAARIMAIPAAHHRLNFIHPFPDGNGRVSRLMSHAMAQYAGIGAHGLWSVSRGLARGLANRQEYKSMMDNADATRRSDIDGRGNLSQRALEEFTLWFLQVCLDQVKFMAALFEIETLEKRLKRYVDQSETLKPEAVALLAEALVRGQFDRGEIVRITGLPERTARRVLNDTLAEGLLGSDTPKSPVSLRFPSKALDILLPRLYVEA